MALSGQAKLGIGVVVLGGLSFLVWQQQKKDAQIGTVAEKAAEMPEIKGPDDLDKISIVNGEKGEVVLEKSGDKWNLTKPVKAPANAANVKSLLDNLKDLKAKELVTPAATEDIKKDYQLDAAHAIHLVGFKGADKKVDDWFGKSGGRGELVMVGDGPQVYASTGFSSFLYGREVKAWRDTEIFKFDDANATQVTIENKNGPFSFTKGDKWAGTVKGKPIDKFDDAKVGDMVRVFKALNAEDFGDGKPTSDTGLDAPESTVTILLKDNAGKFVLKVGKIQGGNAHYAQKDGDPTIYVIGAAASDWATADLPKFEKSPDAGAAKPASSGPGPMAMPQMGGRPGMPPGMQMPAGHPPVPGH